jgi:hypothetical protein
MDRMCILLKILEEFIRNSWPALDHGRRSAYPLGELDDLTELAEKQLIPVAR